MNWIHVFITPDNRQDDHLEIAGAKYHHLVHVRRVRVGAQLRAALPDGRLLCAEVDEITPDRLRARILREEAPCGLSPCRITLYQAVLKGEKMDLLVQKASELGATTLVPVMARRSIPRWAPKQAAERAERWQRIAESASEQCERSIPMVVTVPRQLAETLDNAADVKFLLHERHGRALSAIFTEYPALRDIGVYIGPEGGWDEREVAMLLDAGVLPVHLGGRILRAETAGLVAVTLVQYLWGDLGVCSLEGE